MHVHVLQFYALLYLMVRHFHVLHFQRPRPLPFPLVYLALYVNDHNFLHVGTKLNDVLHSLQSRN